MAQFKNFSGFVTKITDLRQGQNEETSGCYKMITLENKEGSIVNFVAAPNTYFVNHEAIFTGDEVTGFYDANKPVILIYPPQYEAIVMSKISPTQNIKVDYFNSQLISSDENLKLNLSSSTEILLTNDQPFRRNPANKNLIVVYGPSTKSIPAQTTPYKIIVLCRGAE
ncbi:hypothetical protein NBE98_06480 [Clostridium swellfunianum]|uniref:hypothetical protein n=1 Tax=Clostridium swellfunianum TaxID=1367462 RepID=UPI0020304DDF|nr:hypothetical protein [Clostridium swellfunianum]MCM0648017.1 hypothetical protein [Clostridium swellfunianum]